MRHSRTLLPSTRLVRHVNGTCDQTLPSRLSALILHLNSLFKCFGAFFPLTIFAVDPVSLGSSTDSETALSRVCATFTWTHNSSAVLGRHPWLFCTILLPLLDWADQWQIRSRHVTHALIMYCRCNCLSHDVRRDSHDYACILQDWEYVR